MNLERERDLSSETEMNDLEDRGFERENTRRERQMRRGRRGRANNNLPHPHSPTQIEEVRERQRNRRYNTRNTNTFNHAFYESDSDHQNQQQFNQLIMDDAEFVLSSHNISAQEDDDAEEEKLVDELYNEESFRPSGDLQMRNSEHSPIKTRRSARVKERGQEEVKATRRTGIRTRGMAGHSDDQESFTRDVIPNKFRTTRTNPNYSEGLSFEDSLEFAEEAFDSFSSLPAKKKKRPKVKRSEFRKELLKIEERNSSENENDYSYEEFQDGIESWSFAGYSQTNETHVCSFCNKIGSPYLMRRLNFQKQDKNSIPNKE